MYVKHGYNVRLHSFYCLKWRHLVNRLPLDNATLKLQHRSASRAFAGHASCLCNRTPRSTVSITDEKVLAKGYCQTSVQDAVIASECCSKRSRHDLTLPEVLCHSCNERENVNIVEPNMWPPNNPDLNLVNGVVSGSTLENSLSLQMFQVCARNIKCDCHRRSLTEVSANDGIVLKMQYSEMADTSNMFVKENYKPPTAFNLKPFSIVYLCNIM